MRTQSMKATYRGCQIESYSDECIGGWLEVYWSAFSVNGYEIASGFGGGSVEEMFTAMKQNVDTFLDMCGGNPDKHEELLNEI